MTDKLSEFFASSIALLRQYHSAQAIRSAFEAEMDSACLVRPKYTYARQTSAPAITEQPVVCIQSCADMRAIMQDFLALYRAEMRSTELHWFTIMLEVVEGGRKLLGKQVLTVNSISERIAGMAIIL